MVGGFAINLHGYNRSTKDIDIWIEDTLNNRKRLRKALKEQGSGDYEPIETMQFVPGWTNFQLNMGFILDVMVNVKGLEEVGFDECFHYAVIAEIEGIPVRFYIITTSSLVKKQPDDRQTYLMLKNWRRSTI